MTELQTTPDGAPVLRALTWAAEVAADPDRLASPPTRPDAAQWKSVPMVAQREHLDAILVGRGVDHGLEALQRMGFFATLLPEVEAMVDLGDAEWRHKDVWKHTKQVVMQSVPRLTVRWGALLHDIGKPRTRKIDERGRVTFHGHAELGARMFRRKVSKRLAFDKALSERVHFLILYHLRPSQYEASWTDAAVRRFYKQMGEGLTDLLDLGRADITTKRPAKRKRGVKNIADLKKRIDAIRAEDAKVPPLPKGLGKEVMERFGIPPSKQLGDLMKMLEMAAEAGEVESNQDFEHYLAFLDAHRERFGIADASESGPRDC